MRSWQPRSTTTPSTRRPTRPTNERVHDSRVATSRTIGWSDDAVDRVGSMIEATEHGAPGAGHALGDTAILLDADLAILGADPAGYSAYVAGVRSEYRHVDDDDWRAGRAEVLRGFLERAAIYLTSAGRERWESRARANVAAELAALTG